MRSCLHTCLHDPTIIDLVQFTTKDSLLVVLSCTLSSDCWLNGRHGKVVSVKQNRKVNYSVVVLGYGLGVDDEKTEVKKDGGKSPKKEPWKGWWGEDTR